MILFLKIIFPDKKRLVNMSKKETNFSEERITNTDEKVLTLIKDIMSDFTEVVKC